MQLFWEMLKENPSFLFMSTNRLYACRVMMGLYHTLDRALKTCLPQSQAPTNCFEQHYGVIWLHFHTPYNKSWGILCSVFNTEAIILITCHGTMAYYGHLLEFLFPAFAFPETQSHIFKHYCCTKNLLWRILRVSFYLISELFPTTKHIQKWVLSLWIHY